MRTCHTFLTWGTGVLSACIGRIEFVPPPLPGVDNPGAMVGKLGLLELDPNLTPTPLAAEIRNK